jgi:tetratricopeptide (TPR) repeat protein
MPEMRTFMRNQLYGINIPNVTLTSNVREALDSIRKRHFDVILCDYYLGENTDGQQFLEYLRTNNSISRATLFIMITAETGFNSVITAAECMPDDYLLKPFTGETLRIRLERLLERKNRLAEIDKLQDKGAWSDIIKACDEIINSKDKYVIDGMRIKGNALLMSNQIDEAINFYEQVGRVRDMPWVKLGLAKALRAKGQVEQAGQILKNIIQENPKLLAAYDMLGRIHTEAGHADEALAILDDACKIAPNSLARQRSIANLAEENGNFARVDKALSVVLKQTKNSPLRDPNDFAKLGNALTEIGELDRAIAVLKDAKDNFKEAKDVKLLAAVEAVTQKKAGNDAAAQKALELALRKDGIAPSAATSMAIAKACLAHDKKEAALDILKNMVQNNPDSANLQSHVTQVLKDFGGEDAAQELIARSSNEVIQLNNEAVMKAKAGQYAEASKMLTEAALRLPDNMQIVSNASLSLYADLLSNGVDAGKLMQAKQFQQVVLRKNAQHPKLAEINAFQLKLQAKYKLNSN